jgi:hypothetical protein
MMDINNIWDIVNSINNKDYLYDEFIFKKEYKQYTILQAFSYYPDTIMLVNELNMYGGISNKEHYDFLFNATTKRNRRSKWFKNRKDNIVAELSVAYQVSEHKMQEILHVLTEDQINYLKEKIEKGGN